VTDERYLVPVRRTLCRRSAGIVVAALLAVATSASGAPVGGVRTDQLPPKAYLWSPAWSPDGKQIAFTDTTARGDLWVMNADGSGLRKLTNSRPFTSGSPNYGARQPAWSPDGRTIAFGYGSVGISLIEADGSRLRPFVRRYSFGADWSPGGKWIAFAAAENETDGTSIWVKSPDGARQRLVARPPCCNYSYNDPTWSPDGERLAFTVGQAPDSNPVENYVAVVDRFRGPLTRLTFGRRYPADLDWSPSGREIVFSDWSRISGTRPKIVALTLGTGVIRRVGTGLTPSWSPDGRQIAFSLGGRIWVMRADGSGAHPLTPRPRRRVARPRRAPWAARGAERREPELVRVRVRPDARRS
jgi:Tol biopolymer transport system component